MQYIFKTETYNETVSRIEKLKKSDQANWGKMSVSQMLHHCQGPINIMLQKKNYGLKPNWLIKIFVKKTLYNDLPYRKNLPTLPVLRIIEEKDFNTEKKALLNLVKELYENRNKQSWAPHPVFGTFTNEQWAKLQYKHLDHHLRQFGA